MVKTHATELKRKNNLKKKKRSTIPYRCFTSGFKKKKKKEKRKEKPIHTIMRPDSRPRYGKNTLS